MSSDVVDADGAARIAREYANEECVGEFGEVLDVHDADGVWVVEFRTHTFSDAYDHRVRVNGVGNVFSHERSTQEE